MRLASLVAVFFALFILSGCSTKSEKAIYNKPALYWYEQIVKSIKDADLEKADDMYTSLSSEHVASPLLPEAMLILAQAHVEEEEYLLANFYLDEYIKRFGNEKKSEYARFMKIKANFDSFPSPNRNQQLMLDTITQIKDFIQKYPNSKYRAMVETMLVKVRLGNYYLNQNIASLYHRIDKPEAAKVYEEKLATSTLKDAKMIEPDVPWYRSIFE
ncbi:MAG: outer membrane protein assembly factor BamD [Sulfurospirillum sp.]|jgi:outer membrane protein assembly factor BamD|nr:outer membrane protein assembly factor BamD [Sulfurospirillum sp.]